MRADGTAADKESATACSAASTAMSVATHNSETFSGGDVLVLCDDGGSNYDLSDAKFIAPSSGSTDNPIVYRPETGADITITAKRTLTNWTGPNANGEWSKSSFINPAFCADDGVMLVRDGTVGSLESDEFGYFGGKIYIAVDPSTNTIECSQRSNVFDLYQDWVTIQDLAFEWGHGLIDIQGSNITIQDCTFEWAVSYAIRAASSGAAYTNISVIRNDFLDAGNANIEYDTVTNSLISNNKIVFSTNWEDVCVDQQWAHGITVWDGSTGVEISYNWVYRNFIPDRLHGSAIKIYNSDSNIVMYNLLGPEMGDTLALGRSDYNLIYNNVIYKPADHAGFPGIAICDGSTIEPASPVAPSDYNRLKNNIVIQVYDAGHANQRLLRCKSEGLTNPGCGNNNIIDSNLWFHANHPGTPDMFYWRETGDSSTEYYTWTEWRAFRSGKYDANSLNTDPDLEDVTADKFWPKEDSLVINNGENLGDNYDEGWDPTTSFPPNTVSTLNQDDYGSGWEIGAYIYTPPTNQIRGIKLE